jgi:hypothetical protein
MLDAELKPDFMLELEQSEQWVLMRNRRRLGDDEQIQTEEAAASAVVKEFSAAVSEPKAKGGWWLSILRGASLRLLAMRADGFMPSDIVATPRADEAVVGYAVENFHNGEVGREPTTWLMAISAANRSAATPASAGSPSGQ